MLYVCRDHELTHDVLQEVMIRVKELAKNFHGRGKHVTVHIFLWMRRLAWIEVQPLIQGTKNPERKEDMFLI